MVAINIHENDSKCVTFEKTQPDELLAPGKVESNLKAPEVQENFFKQKNIKSLFELEPYGFRPNSQQ